MELNVQFKFRNKSYSCSALIDTSADPCFVFVILEDKALIKEFGEEVTIKTDGWKLLPKKDDYAELVELRQALFVAVKKFPEFINAKNRLMRCNQSQGRFLAHPSFV